MPQVPFGRPDMGPDTHPVVFTCLVVGIMSMQWNAHILSIQLDPFWKMSVPAYPTPYQDRTFHHPRNFLNTQWCISRGEQLLPRGKKALLYCVSWSLWCEYSYHGQFQAVSVMTLKAESGRQAHIRFLKTSTSRLQHSPFQVNLCHPIPRQPCICSLSP